MAVTIGCAAFLGLVVLLCAGFILDISRAPTHDPRNEAPGTISKAYEAWGITEKFVTEMVKSPSTANFGGWFNGEKPSEHVAYNGNYEYSVAGWVDAQNGFGAIVRSDFVLKLRDNRDGTWRMVDVPIVNQR